MLKRQNPKRQSHETSNGQNYVEFVRHAIVKGQKMSEPLQLEQKNMLSKKGPRSEII